MDWVALLDPLGQNLECAWRAASSSGHSPFVVAEAVVRLG